MRLVLTIVMTYLDGFSLLRPTPNLGRRLVHVVLRFVLHVRGTKTAPPIRHRRLRDAHRDRFHRHSQTKAVPVLVMPGSGDEAARRGHRLGDDRLIDGHTEPDAQDDKRECDAL